MQEKISAMCRNYKMRFYSNNEPCKDKVFNPLLLILEGRYSK